jgi:hypothetical protein
VCRGGEKKVVHAPDLSGRGALELGICLNPRARMGQRQGRALTQFYLVAFMFSVDCNVKSVNFEEMYVSSVQLVELLGILINTLFLCQRCALLVIMSRYPIVSMTYRSKLS